MGSQLSRQQTGYPATPPVLAYCSEALQRTLNHLVDALTAKEGEGPGTIFLLGAGCSIQYGLPGFRRLLAGLCEDLWRDAPEELANLQLEALRKKLDFEFRHPSRKLVESLARRLGNVSGWDCPGYRRLARLMEQGLVRRTLTMNFDTLLEEACSAERLDLDRITKIHGCITNEPYAPVLDMRNTELFIDAARRRSTSRILREHNVVVLGYSGVDTPMCEALMPRPRRGAIPPKLFYIGIEPPSPLLDSAIIERRCGDFRIIDPEAGTFENFMQCLEATLDYRSKWSADPDPVRGASQGKAAHLTPPELKALSRCLTRALRIRSMMNIADASATSIEDHGHALFALCVDLAERTRIRLTSPEKYLLYCASFLHDLGYFLAYNGGKINEHPGWHLLNHHGEQTAELLEGHRERLLEELVPESYGSAAAENLIAILVELCRQHSRVEPPDMGDAAFPALAFTVTRLPVGRYEVAVRFRILHALLATAEEISTGHPFLPSGDPLDPGATPDFVIDDPVLDLYLRRKDEAVKFEPRGSGFFARGVTGSATSSPSQAVVEWLMVLAQRAVDHLNDAVTSPDYGGDALEFDTGDRELPLEKSDGELLAVALGETLERRLAAEKPESPGASLRILDLLALYMLDTSVPDKQRSAEPRVPPKSDIGRKAVKLLGECSDEPHEGLLQYYLPLLVRGSSSPMEEVFARDVREIYLPAWRFCAYNWRRGVAPVVMACASLDLGSTLHRSEVTYGLRSLPVSLPPAGHEPRNEDHRSGHDGCTLCTGRLLYVLSYERLLRHESQAGEANGTAEDKRAEVDRKRETFLPAIVRYLLEEKDSRIWWGIEKEVTETAAPQQPAGRARPSALGVRAADYIASALRGIAFCLWVDSRIRERNSRGILTEPDRDGLRTVFTERLQDLCAATGDDLLSQQSEEPHSYILGETARTYLTLHRLRAPRGGNFFDIDIWLRQARTHLAEAVEQLTKGTLSQVSQFYLLPAFAFLHGTAEGKEAAVWKDTMVETYVRCSESSIWIKTGPDAGSWGYNLENTARLVLAFSTFWRHAFDHRGDFEGLFAAP